MGLEGWVRVCMFVHRQSCVCARVRGVWRAVTVGRTWTQNTGKEGDMDRGDSVATNGGLSPSFLFRWERKETKWVNGKRNVKFIAETF